jgi:hypothetical protein
MYGINHHSHNMNFSKSIGMKNKRAYLIAIIIAAVLLIPFIAMQFTKQVNWGFGDFIAAALLLSATGIACELVWRKITKPGLRSALCMGILAMLLLVWTQLAVGIF